jgi:uncharacterized protein (TIGR04255 family)
MASAGCDAGTTRTGLQPLRQACYAPQRGDGAHTVMQPPSRSVFPEGAATRSRENYSAQTGRVYAMVDSVAGVGASIDSVYKSGLPDFTRPPLVEVAVGLMFEPLEISPITLAQLYSQWQEDYPSFEEHPAIPSSPSVPGLIFEVSVPRVRFWFLNNSGRLIQVQRDRLIVNWRKEAASAAYPRYGSLRVELEKRVTQFSEFLESRHKGPLRPNAIEVTYVNQVPLAGKSPNLSDIVALLQSAPKDVGLPVETNLSVRFDVSSQLERKSAALVINAQRSPTVDPPLAVLQLSCSIPVYDLPDAFDALDKARYHVVQSFQSVTTDKMHDEWGIER